MSLYLIEQLYKINLYKYTANKGLWVTFINLNILYKEMSEVVALLWANKIILGERTYSQVPPKLKTAVAAELKIAGCEDLITE